MKRDGGAVDQSERDLERLIQSLLGEASRWQWEAALDTKKARELLVRMKECAAKSGAAGFRLGQVQLQWAVDLIERRLREEKSESAPP
jgi:hypothetical protein